MDGAGVGCALDLGLLFLAVFPVGHIEDKLNLADAVGFGAHFLVDAHGHPAHIDVVLAGKEGHHGHGASAKRRGAQLDRVEAVEDGIGLVAGMGGEFGATLKVFAFDVQIALVGQLCKVCHGIYPCGIGWKFCGYILSWRPLCRPAGKEIGQTIAVGAGGRNAKTSKKAGSGQERGV